jgi:DNA-binding transcriptional MerR regulator
MFFQEIKIDTEHVQELLATDAEGIKRYAELYAKRKFYVGDIGINRKTLIDWKRSGLFPYPFAGKGWQKFSFLEWVWLECVNEFRHLGVSLEKIKNIKKEIFDFKPADFISDKQQQIEKYEGAIDQKELVISSYTDPGNTDEIKQQLVDQFQFGLFLEVLLNLVVTDQNICIVYNNSDFSSFLLFGPGDKNARKANQEVFANLIDDSFIVVNLRKVVHKLFQKPKLRHNDDFIIDFLLPKEKKIFDHIRNTNAKEITIVFDKNNKPTHIRVNRNQISREILNKVARYLKQGNYQSVTFTTRNGDLVKYEEEDSIRLE